MCFIMFYLQITGDWPRGTGDDGFPMTKTKDSLAANGISNFTAVRITLLEGASNGFGNDDKNQP